MGNIRIFSRAGYQDISVWRNQTLNSINSTTSMSWDNVKFDMTTFSAITLDVYTQEDFGIDAPILSFSLSGGTIVPGLGGFYLSIPAATMDIIGNTYYYNLLGDSELLLSGKFVINEYPNQT